MCSHFEPRHEEVSISPYWLKEGLAPDCAPKPWLRALYYICQVILGYFVQGMHPLCWELGSGRGVSSD